MNPSQHDAEGYLLLTIPEATVEQTFDGQNMPLARGEVQIECVSMPIPAEIGHQTANPFAVGPNEPPATHDLWLVMRVGDDFEHTFAPGNMIEARSPPGGDGEPKYLLREPAVAGSHLTVSLLAPRSVAELEDLGTFEALLQQYGVLHGTALDGVTSPMLGAGSLGYGHSDKATTAPPSSAYDEKRPQMVHGGSAEDLRGHLVLVDEKTGAVLGEIDQPTDSGGKAEAEALAQQDPDRPVLIDFGEVVARSRKVTVTQIPPDELDGWMLKGADSLSKGILAVGAAGSAAMMSGANKFRQKTLPRPKPITFSPTTKSGFQQFNSITNKGQTVSGKTVNAISNTIQRVVEKKDRQQGTAHSTNVQSPTEPKKSTLSSGLSKLVDTAMPAVDALRQKAGYGTSSPSYNQTDTAYGQHAAPVAAPPLPARPGSPGKTGAVGAGAPGAFGGPPALPPRGEKTYPPSYHSSEFPHEKHESGATQVSPAGSGPQTPIGPKKKRGFFNRTLLAADVVLSSFEAAASDLVTSGTAAASSAVGYRYGQDAGEAVALTGAGVRNAMLVYVDVRGVGRRSVLKATAKGYVKARLKSGETVTLQPYQAGQAAPTGNLAGSHAGEGEMVVNVPQASEKRRL